MRQGVWAIGEEKKTVMSDERNFVATLSTQLRVTKDFLIDARDN